MEEQKINSVEVYIAGEKVTLSGTESVAYIQGLARYIDKKISELQRTKGIMGINSFMKTLLISANIADDFLKSQDRCHHLEQQLEACIQELGKMQEENIRLAERLRETQMALTHTQIEWNKLN